MRARGDQSLELRNDERDDRCDEHERVSVRQPVQIDHHRERRDERCTMPTTSCGSETLTASVMICEIGREARHQFAGTPPVELGERQFQQPFEEPHAQARDQVLAAPRRQVRLAVRRGVRQNDREKRRRASQGRAREIRTGPAAGSSTLLMMMRKAQGGTIESTPARAPEQRSRGRGADSRAWPRAPGGTEGLSGGSSARAVLPSRRGETSRTRARYV